jgi:hypothetical protein
MMESGMISKIQKAKRYAQEKDRITFEQFRVRFRGEHDTYTLTFDEGKWTCQCNFFLSHGVCSHTMALERILGVMLPVAASKEGVPQGT